MENSQVEQAVIFSVISMKNMVTKQFKKFTTENRTAMKDNILRYLVEKGPYILKKEILSPIVILLTRIVQLSWFDAHEFPETVTNLLEFLNVSKPCLIF